MMGLPKQNTFTTTTSTSDITEDDHAKRKRERETSADLLNEHEHEEELTPADAEGLCPPKKRGKEAEEDLETTSVRKNMEEMVCKDQKGGDAEEMDAGNPTTSQVNKDTKLPGDIVDSIKETTTHGNQTRSSQSSSKAAAEFIPSKRSGNNDTALKPTLPQSSTPSYTLPEGSFSKNKDALPLTTSSAPIVNPFLKNVGETNDNELEDVDDTKTGENENVTEPPKNKYAFGQTLGPGAADIGRSTPVLATTPQIISTSSSSLSSAPTSAFGASYAGATFGSTAASGSSIFGSGSLGFGAASGSSPFAALSTTGDSTTPLAQTSVFDQPEATTDANEVNEDDENSDEDDDTENGDDGAGAVFGSVNIPLVPEQEVITGEENEATLHQVKGKLFVMEEAVWRERGAGTLKLKITMNETGGRPRLVMRTDAVLRLILNTPLFSGMAKKIVQEKFVVFAGIDGEGRPTSFGFRAPSPIAAADLCEAIDRALNEYL